MVVGGGRRGRPVIGAGVANHRAYLKVRTLNFTIANEIQMKE